jgi:hypothetical protein
MITGAVCVRALVRVRARVHRSRQLGMEPRTGHELLVALTR